MHGLNETIAEGFIKADDAWGQEVCLDPGCLLSQRVLADWPGLEGKHYVAASHTRVGFVRLHPNW